MTPSTSLNLTPDDSHPEVSRLREDYGHAAFDEADLATTWVRQFGVWLADAISASLPEPNAMIVATATDDAIPSARTVLLRAYAETGFTFFTNYQSRKGVELLANPKASLVFPWFAIRRQVVVCGAVDQVSMAETEEYFATRPRESQLGAWASRQSSVVADRGVLERAYDEVARRFPGEVPAPPYWGGFRVKPDTVEFWQGRTGRLHDRLRYHRTEGGWVTERLSP